MKQLGAVLAASLFICAAINSARAESRIGSSVSGMNCAAVVQDCFGHADSETLDCFHDSASHSSCAGQPLGKLAYQRWALSAGSQPGYAPPAFMGPQLVDQKCVANFDRELFSNLVAEKINETAVSQLSGKLEKCRQKDAQLPRP